MEGLHIAFELDIIKFATYARIRFSETSFCVVLVKGCVSYASDRNIAHCFHKIEAEVSRTFRQLWTDTAGKSHKYYRQIQKATLKYLDIRVPNF